MKHHETGPVLVGRVSVDSGALVVGDPLAFGIETTPPGDGLDPLDMRGHECALIGRFGGDGLYRLVVERDRFGLVVRATVFFCEADYLAEHGDREECAAYVRSPAFFPDGYRAQEIAARA